MCVASFCNTISFNRKYSILDLKFSESQTPNMTAAIDDITVLQKCISVCFDQTVLFSTAGDGQRREELLPGHTQTDQEENQRVQALPPGALRRFHQLTRGSRADGPVEGRWPRSGLYISLCIRMKWTSFWRDGRHSDCDRSPA